MSSNRRTFLRKGLLSAAGLSMTSMMPAKSLITAGSSADDKVGRRKLDEIGLQASTISKLLGEDYKTTLKTVAVIGYDTIEMGDSMGPSREEFKQFLKEIGLKALSGGTSMSGLRQNLAEQISSSLAMGKEYLVCFWPWTDSGENKTIDDWKLVAESLNVIGKEVSKAGMVFAYHNHDIEFRETAGQIPYDILLEKLEREASE